jgi:uncharacterized membrane protein
MRILLKIPIHPEKEAEISLRRLQTLTDCVFALALVLLVLFIEKPPQELLAHPTEKGIMQYLLGESDTIIIFVVTFVMIALYWFANHDQSKYLRRSDDIHVGLTLVYLAFIALLPFTNGLNMVFRHSLLVHIFYSSVVFLVGFISYVDWIWASRNDRLIDSTTGSDIILATTIETLIQPCAAVLSFGGALIGTLWWQLPFMLAPVATIILKKVWPNRKQGDLQV